MLSIAIGFVIALFIILLGVLAGLYDTRSQVERQMEIERQLQEAKDNESSDSSNTGRIGIVIPRQTFGLRRG